MVSALHNFLIILLNTECMLGILGNVFIALMNFIDWLKKRKISLADRVLTALAISRICMMCIVVSYSFATEFYSSSYTNRMGVMFTSGVGAVTTYFSNWLATGLSLFYFLKIANFSNPVFLHLKHRVEMVVLRVLLGVLVFLPLNLLMISMYINEIHSYEKNVTLSSKRSDTKNFSKLIVSFVGSILPFLISLNLFMLLIFSLWKHLKNMKNSATGFRDARVKAHITAMLNVISFILLFAVYFLSLVITTFHVEVMKNQTVLLLGQAIANVYPSIHSFVLILGNNKLRKASHSVLLAAAVLLKNGRPSGS